MKILISLRGIRITLVWQPFLQFSATLLQFFYSCHACLEFSPSIIYSLSIPSLLSPLTSLNKASLHSFHHLLTSSINSANVPIYSFPLFAHLILEKVGSSSLHFLSQLIQPLYTYSVICYLISQKSLFSSLSYCYSA